MIDKTKLNYLYSLYGFQKGNEKKDATVFLYTQGYFHNAEVIQLSNDDKDAEILCRDYADLGYSVHKKFFSTIEEIHKTLFHGFFNTAVSNQRLLVEYKDFCNQQTNRLGGNEYSYVEGNYYVNNELKEAGIVDFICNSLNAEKATLVILEAAAGFGKTCTSYEIIKNIVSVCPNKVPIMAELSKNRKASIFKYVLLSEIDRKFSTLSSDLVTAEIKNGNVPLIIDGFDEILSKSTTQTKFNSDDAANAQTMLETIATLLTNESKAKILLTSRKSSIFTGEEFDEWVQNHLDNCSIIRIQLAQPTIQNWIGAEKVDLLQKKGISLNNISNPVLLTIIRNESIGEIEKNYRSANDVLNKYFNLLLSREQTRQYIVLSNEEQLKIIEKLASYMVLFDISSEDPKFIRDLLFEIVKPNLDEFLNRYNTLALMNNEIRPSQEEFIMALVHHALLDRVSSQSNKIGFINEFIFGIMIGNAVIDHLLPIKEMSSKYMDLAATAYSIKDLASRQNLYTILEPSFVKLSQQQKLNIDLLLMQKITSDYKEEYFDSLMFGHEIIFDGLHKFINCIFSSCIFDKCEINVSTFKTCQFYDCKFYDVDVTSDVKQDLELIFSNCIGHEKLAQASYYNPGIVTKDSNDYEKIVLQQYWKVGYERAEPRRTYRTLFRGISAQDNKNIAKAIDSLISQKILIKQMFCLELNFAKMDEIKNILGR